MIISIYSRFPARITKKNYSKHRWHFGFSEIQENLLEENILICPTMVGKGQRKFTVLLAL